MNSLTPTQLNNEPIDGDLDDDRPDSISEIESVSNRSSAVRFRDYQLILDMISSSSVDPVIISSSVGRIKSVNNQSLELFRYERWELIEKNLNVLMPPEVAKIHDKFLYRYNQTQQARILGELRSGIFGKKKNDELFPVILKVSKLNTNDGHTFIGIIRNRSDDHELDRSRTLLKQSWPSDVLKRLIKNDRVSEKKEVTVCRVELTNFDQYSKEKDATEIISTLNYLFEKFDKCAVESGIEKLNLIDGSEYVAGCGMCPGDPESHGIRVVNFCLKVSQIMKDEEFDIRIAVTTGMAVVGVIGEWKPSFEVMSDDVKNLSYLKTVCPVNKILVSNETYRHTSFRFKYSESSVLPNERGGGKVYVLNPETAL